MPKLNRLKNSKIVVAFLSLPLIVRFLVALLVVLLAAFVFVMFSECAEGLIGGFLGLPEKNEILKFLGIGMGGVLLAIQAVMSFKRAQAMEDAAKAQAGATKQQAKANENTEKGLRQERLKNAIEHLGHGSDSVRLGGAYELFHLAEEIKELRRTVFDILCAHIRRTTGEAEYREKHKSKPSEEIQSLLTLLFVQEHKVFNSLHINLHGSWLNGADLFGVRLHGATLTMASLQGAFLMDANLQGALLRDVRLQFADLRGARLQGAVLHLAGLQGADMKKVWLQGAYLGGAELQVADLNGAKLQGTRVWLDHHETFAGFKTFAERIQEGISQEGDLFSTEARFSGAKFEGGLKKEDMDSLVEGISEAAAKMLQNALEPHIGQPESRELSENSGAVTGAYTKEEAEGWIAEYEKAMSMAD